MEEKFLCVISMEAFGEHGIHDIQTNTAWEENPYDGYALVPEELAEAVIQTRGFCDITVENGILTAFTERDIPEMGEETEKTMYDELAEAYQEGVNSIV